MKKLFTITIALLLLPLFTFAQKGEYKGIKNFPTAADGKVVYEGVVEVPGATKDELYTKAREWFAKSFANSKDAMQMEDKEAGKIVGKSGFRVNDIPYHYTMSLDFKDGKYRYQVTDIYWSDISRYGKAETFSLEDQANSNLFGKQARDKVLAKVNTSILDIIASLGQAIKPGSTTSKDW